MHESGSEGRAAELAIYQYNPPISENPSDRVKRARGLTLLLNTGEANCRCGHNTVVQVQGLVSLHHQGFELGSLAGLFLEYRGL
jgi:hypothetical protein